MPETTSTKPANFADDEEKEDGENMEDGGNVVDVDAVCKAIEDGSISVEAMDRIIAAIQAQSAASEAPEEAEDEASQGAPAPAPGAEVMRAGKGGDAVAFAKLRGEHDALKARLDARDAEDKRRADVDEAMKLLEGKVVGSDPRAKLEAFHQEVGGNAKAFKAYVTALASSAGPQPDGDDGANFSAQPNTPKAAMPWAGKGSVAFDKAVGFARQAEHHFSRKSAEWKENYVRVNMEREGFKIEENAA